MAWSRFPEWMCPIFHMHSYIFTELQLSRGFLWFLRDFLWFLSHFLWFLRDFPWFSTNQSIRDPLPPCTQWQAGLGCWILLTSNPAWRSWLQPTNQRNQIKGNQPIKATKPNRQTKQMNSKKKTKAGHLPYPSAPVVCEVGQRAAWIARPATESVGFFQ